MEIKKYETNNNGKGRDIIYVGPTRDIEAMYNKMYETNVDENGNECMFVIEEGSPFSKEKAMYGICVSYDNFVSVLSSDTVLEMLFKGELVLCKSSDKTIYDMVRERQAANRKAV